MQMILVLLLFYFFNWLAQFLCIFNFYCYFRILSRILSHIFSLKTISIIIIDNDHFFRLLYIIYICTNILEWKCNKFYLVGKCFHVPYKYRINHICTCRVRDSEPFLFLLNHGKSVNCGGKKSIGKINAALKQFDSR